jgi:putative membrane-bound dehydrogenase-like protein
MSTRRHGIESSARRVCFGVSAPGTILIFVGLAALLAPAIARSEDGAPTEHGNRLTYLDHLDPYYVSLHSPRLTTPQWVGEEGMDAVVILGIDDMYDKSASNSTSRYENVLRLVLNRLKQIDGKAHLSIMTRWIDPQDPQLQTWLKEGVSLETHTKDHPCPLLADGDFARARSTFDDCVDRLSEVANSHPVAFRMPCCDSKNTPSPRAWAEIFNKTTTKGNFVRIDTSVFDLFTPNDPALPRSLVTSPDGAERFARYIPFDLFANTIDDYPYPYVIGKLCWEFPCVVPSDWESENIFKSASPRLLEDWKAALDATVLKKGVMDIVFHPYGWSTPQQQVALIDYAAGRYGKRVKFLNFKEALQRLEKNVLGGQELRAANGQDNGVRLLDLNNDGYMDAVIGNDQVRQTRIWSPQKREWIVSEFPTRIVNVDEHGNHSDAGVRFGIVSSDGYPSAIVHNEQISGAWHFDGHKWVSDPALLAGLDVIGPVLTCDHGIDRGVRLNDLDNSGHCELIVGNDKQNAVFAFNEQQKQWTTLPFALPAGTSIIDSQGRDAGLRLIDVDGDGHTDVLFSNESRYSLDLFVSMQQGWSKHILGGRRQDQREKKSAPPPAGTELIVPANFDPTGDKEPLPPLVRNGTDNGGWFMHRALWVQNEDTAKLRGGVQHVAFREMLDSVFASPRSPQASLRSIELLPGFQAELAVTEPLVQSPIACAWGADGKLWVVEMGDYPLGVDGKGKPGGRVVLLQDTHGDGRYVKASVFLDNLPFPTGIMPWGKGVLITDAPNILYAEDTKGTGKADVVKVLYTGFVEGNQQHRVNGLQYGLDNWVHGANGESGGHIKSLKTGQVVDISGRDFRIKPDEGLIEATTGVSQYGHTMDDWGNWFGSENSVPDRQFVLDERYLRRNRNFAPPPAAVEVPDVPGTAPVYPISPDLPRFNDPGALHHFTSADSLTIYRDDLFGPLFYGNTFVSEAAANLMHREIMRREGVLFHSKRAADAQHSEFFASFDTWTRPTMLRSGPDGALWLVDMYRMVIEHPEWIPKDWQAKLDLRAGHELGRIYRIFPVGSLPRKIPRFDHLDTAGLVAALDSPGGWQRDTIQQLLVQRHDMAAVPLLEQAARGSKRDVCRLQAICTLDGLNALTPEILARALSDPQPGIRRQAVRLCEAQFAKTGELGEKVIQLVSDPDPQVRMQVAYSLGEWNDPRASQALGRLAVANRDQPYIEAAVMTSLTPDNLEPVLTAFSSSSNDAPLPGQVLSNLLRFAHAVGDNHAVAAMLSQAAEPHDGKLAVWQLDAVGVLLDALDSSRTSLEELSAQADAPMKAALTKLSTLLDMAAATVKDPAAPDQMRLACIGVLGRDPHRQKSDLALLSALLEPQTPAQLQAAVISAMGRLKDAAAPESLLHGWKTYTPSARAHVLDAILNRPEWVADLVEALKQKKLMPGDFDAIRRQRLLGTADAALRRQAAELFADVIKPDRQRVVEAYQPVLKLKGDAKHGAQLFTATCAACHHFGGVGNAVGPDLASIGDKSPGTLLISILDPNRHIEPKYIAYLVQTKDGRTLSGVLGDETATSITLLQANTPPMQILRTQINVLRATGITLMPEGLESGLKMQDLADLIAHIRSGAPPAIPKHFEGNVPQTLKPSPDGKVRLTAASAEIFGNSLVFEPKYGNLGYWSSDDDHARWTIDAPKAGTYDVWLDYACPDAIAGNLYLLETDTDRLSGRIEGTGSWDTYRRVKLGTIQLPAGSQQISFRSDGKLNGDLCDLKAIELDPRRR